MSPRRIAREKTCGKAETKRASQQTVQVSQRGLCVIAHIKTRVTQMVTNFHVTLSLLKFILEQF